MGAAIANSFWARHRGLLAKYAKYGGILLGSCILLVSTLWLLWQPLGSEETRYHRSVRNMRLASKLQPLFRVMPSFIATPMDGLLRGPFRTFDKEQHALLASGFLTNISISLKDTLNPLTITEISLRIHQAVPDNHFLPCSIEHDAARDHVVLKVLCRAKDVSRISDAVKDYERQKNASIRTSDANPGNNRANDFTNAGTAPRLRTLLQPKQGSPTSDSGTTELSEFPPSTEGERELERMLNGKDESIDLALANWLVAADIPQFSDLTRERYFARLDAMTEQVRQDMAKRRMSAWRNTDLVSALRCGLFCNAILRLGFAYCEEFRQENLTLAQAKALHADANNTFLAGLLRSKKGSCVSMPLIYLVIGRRLGLPVYLVTIGKHYFIRWEEPGYRMNIEPTIVEKVCVTPDDSVYLETEGVTARQLTGSQMRNLTSREVVGNLLFTRSCYWAVKGANFRPQHLYDLSRARQLCPDDPAIQLVYEAAFKRYHCKPEPGSSGMTANLERSSK